MKRENKLSVNYLGFDMINPFMLASAPPARNREMIDRAFRAGWGGAVIKTLTQYSDVYDASVRDVSPRIFPLRGKKSNFKDVVFGFMNIELTSQQTNEQSCEDIFRLKRDWPDRAVIGSVLYGASPIKEKWCKAARDCELAGADALELNFSCPHGCAEVGSGMSIGENPAKIAEIIGWMRESVRIPLIVKLTALSDIVYSASICEREGADSVCAINTVSSMPDIDINTFLPKSAVGDFGATGGMSGHVIKPIALRSVLEIARATKLPISGCGGIYDWTDAVQFIAAGSTTLQVCSSVMEHGYGIISKLCGGLEAYMESKGFDSVDCFRGKALEHIKPHAELDRKYRVLPSWDYEKCCYCGKCVITCRDGGYQAIEMSKGNVSIDDKKCEGCGLCYSMCPTGALSKRVVLK